MLEHLPSWLRCCRIMLRRISKQARIAVGSGTADSGSPSLPWTYAFMALTHLHRSQAMGPAFYSIAFLSHLGRSTERPSPVNADSTIPVLLPDPWLVASRATCQQTHQDFARILSMACAPLEQPSAQSAARPRDAVDYPPTPERAVHFVGSKHLLPPDHRLVIQDFVPPGIVVDKCYTLQRKVRHY